MSGDGTRGPYHLIPWNQQTLPYEVLARYFAPVTRQKNIIVKSNHVLSYCPKHGSGPVNKRH